MAERLESLRELRHRAEAALDTSAPDTEALLEKLAQYAPKGTEPSIFAHRHLAELRLETDSWRAALHLRHVMRAHPWDDVAHALMGLCHALMGNYRSAVKCYRVAAQVAPEIPWYHHNLGHLIDVALNDPKNAEQHLRRAKKIEPEHDEIIGSLAHCVARLGRLGEASVLAEQAAALAPNNDEHDALIKWIAKGAPAQASPSDPVGVAES